MNFKKPKFWDLKKPTFLSYILLPFIVFIKINNFFLNCFPASKIKKIKTICIGNIYIGGTGKTPTTIKLYNIFRNLNYKVVSGKKYYKSQIDEQIILDKKTKLITAKTRKEIIKKAIDLNYELIVFDDGLQDKNVNYDLKIVCFDTKSWIGNGQLLPAGPLRENLHSLKKYDAIFLKNNNDFDKIKKILINFNPAIKVFTFDYVITNLNKFNLSDNFISFCGLGNPENFKKILHNQNFSIVDELFFSDHHNYKETEINNILKKAKKLNAKIITTEKDYVKIPKKFKNDINYLDINFRIKDEERLINFLKLKLDEKH